MQDLHRNIIFFVFVSLWSAMASAYDMELQMSICTKNGPSILDQETKADQIWDRVIDGLQAQGLDIDTGVMSAGNQVHYDTADFDFYKNGVALKTKYTVSQTHNAAVVSVVKIINGSDQAPVALAHRINEKVGHLSINAEYDVNPPFLRSLAGTSSSERNQVLQTRFQTSMESSFAFMPYDFFTKPRSIPTIQELCAQDHANTCPFGLGQKVMINAFADMKRIPFVPLALPQRNTSDDNNGASAQHASQDQRKALIAVGVLKFSKYKWRFSHETNLPRFEVHLEKWTRIDTGQDSFVELSIKASAVPNQVPMTAYEKWLTAKIAQSDLTVCKTKPSMVEFLQHPTASGLIAEIKK
ncbi:MAG: hypothetical protein KDK51_03300 [Deltaproteobacteria bacterium]|nr:hypothetical protein [Deltaproteobacteria bacterium]